MPKFKIDTQDNLFEPIEIDINGEVYQSVKLTRKLFREVLKKESKTSAGDMDSLYDQIKLIFPTLTDKTLDDLDIREINAMLEHAQKEVYNPKYQKKTVEKKIPKSKGR